MIPLKPYGNELIKIFKEKAKDVLDKELSVAEKEELKDTVNLLFPKKEHGKEYLNELDDLFLLDYSEIKSIITHIDLDIPYLEAICLDKAGKRKPLFEKYFKLYDNLANRQKNNKKLTILMVEDLAISVCPYCNRDYINNRGNLVSGAQLDHFYNRATYPFLSISLYNLVPSCGNCNRTKSSKKIDISPFDMTLDLTEMGQIFKYVSVGVNRYKIELADDSLLKKNVDAMKVIEAYEIHEQEVGDLIILNQIYNSSQQAEINKLMKPVIVNNILNNGMDFKKILFGLNYDNPCYERESLSKLKYDVLVQLGVIKK